MEILPLLQDDIEYLMRHPDCGEPDDVRYSVQVRMVSGDDREWQPRLLILCGTENLRSYLKSELVPYSYALSELSFPGPPIFERFSYAANQEYGPWPSTPQTTKSTLGSRIRLKNRDDEDENWVVTIGGIILVDGLSYGLTIGHYRNFAASNKHGKETWSLAKQSKGLLERETEAEGFGFDEETDEAVDWAIVPMNDGTHFMSNHLTLPSEPNLSLFVDEIMTEHQFVALPDIRTTARTKCVVATAEGPIPGLVARGLATMVLASASFQVLRVELEEMIPAGSSGSWVIVDNRLLGSIIATEDTSPHAYALPIEVTFRSIANALETSKVTLPSAVATRMFELDHLSEASTWFEPANLSNSLERDLLLAVRRAEATSNNTKLTNTGTCGGIGWAGMRREEIMGNSLSLIEPFADPSFKVRMYERLTGLRMDTIRSLMRIGHIFPMHSEYRAVFLGWVARNKVSHVRGTRAIAVRIILEECLCTEAGENLLGLVCTLKVLLQLNREDRKRQGSSNSLSELRAIWMGRLFQSICKGLEFPPIQIPSQRQIQAFVSHCLAGFKGTPHLRAHEHFQDSGGSLSPETLLRGSAEPANGAGINLEGHLPEAEDASYEQLSGVQFFARMLLQLGDLTHGDKEQVLVCAGEPWAIWARTIAQVLGHTVNVRSYQANNSLAIVGLEEPSPDVCVYTGIGIRVSEVVERQMMSEPQEVVTSSDVPLTETMPPPIYLPQRSVEPLPKQGHRRWNRFAKKDRPNTSDRRQQRPSLLETRFKPSKKGEKSPTGRPAKALPKVSSDMRFNVGRRFRVAQIKWRHMRKLITA